MNIISIILLGLVQGITEFLPVSSSGHVLVISRILQNPSSFEFDVLVSFGTLLAIIIYYRRRLVEIAKDILKRKDARFLMKLVVATLPAVVVGFLFQGLIERYLHNITTVIAMLVAIGLLMIFSRDWQPKKSLPANKDITNISYKHALFIGVVQCVSLISGSSRSGVTILAALGVGINREKAAEWSFLMAIPVIFGASMKVLLSESGQVFVRDNFTAFILANTVAFISGLVAIHILLRFLKANGLYWFGWYRIGLAALLLLLLSVKIL